MTEKGIIGSVSVSFLEFWGVYFKDQTKCPQRIKNELF
jgi:hypothetical protein